MIRTVFFKDEDFTQNELDVISATVSVNLSQSGCNGVEINKLGYVNFDIDRIEDANAMTDLIDVALKMNH